MKRHTLKSIIVSLALLLTGSLAVPALATAASKAPPPPTPTQSACNAITGQNDCTDKSGAPTVSSLVRSAINILSLLIGVIAIIMIIVGGLRYVTAAGDANAISGAKNTVIYSLIGLVIAALAQALVQFVLKNVT